MATLPEEYSDRQANKEYMSDMNNWVCVHVTKYEPKQNSNGDLHIKTTAMATGYRLPRASVHMTLNQIVGNNIGGNWNEASIVILAPYKDIVEKNSNPQEVSVDDTYFIPDPEVGLVLPKNAFIVRPSSSNVELIETGEYGVTYKTDNYSEEEIEKILSFNPGKKEEYEMYLKGDVPDYEVKNALNYDERFIKLYESAEDKQAFARGLFEEKRFEILKNILRDKAVEEALEKMGYRYVFAHEDEISGEVAKVAREAGLPGDSGNKGHSNSVEHELEIHGCWLLDLVEVLQSKNTDKIYEYLTSSKKPMSDEVRANIVSGAEIPDFYPSYEAVFNENVARRKEWHAIDKKDNEPDKTREDMWQVMISKMGNNIEEYNTHLCKTLKKHAIRMKIECGKALEDLRQNPEIYAELKQRLNDFEQRAKQNTENYISIDRGGR